MTTAIRLKVAGYPDWAPATAPCAECPARVPAGTTYCSTRCRNAADCHDDMDGDL